MVDRISFTLPGGAVPELENMKISWDGSSRGTYKNMRIIQSPDRIFCSGSVAKYLQGENVSPLTRSTVKEAISKIERDTGWDLHKAELKEVEIGATLPVKEPVSEYLSSWGIVPRFTKNTYHQKNTFETVLYKTVNRSITGYDKRAEAKEIPGIYSDSELLRLELRLKKKAVIYDIFKRSLTPWDLTYKAVYNKLVKLWKDFYFSIPKGRIPILDVTDGASPKDLDNILKLIGIQTVGEDRFLSYVSTLEKKGIYGQTQASRARKTARDILKNKHISEPDIFTRELDSKVRAQVAYIR